MKTILGIFGMIGSLSAFAANDIVCEVPVTGELIKIYNVINETTKEATVPGTMILSQPAFEEGNQTIASLRRLSLAQTSTDAVYTAKVDLRDAGSSHQGELFAETKIKFLKKVSVSLNKEALLDSFADDVEVQGTLILDKRNNDVQTLSVTCNPTSL